MIGYLLLATPFVLAVLFAPRRAACLLDRASDLIDPQDPS